MTNWSSIFANANSNLTVWNTLRMFASGQISKNAALSSMAGDSGSGEFRRLVRRVGAAKARQLMRRNMRERKL